MFKCSSIFWRGFGPTSPAIQGGGMILYSTIEYTVYVVVYNNLLLIPIVYISLVSIYAAFTSILD